MSTHEFLIKRKDGGTLFVREYNESNTSLNILFLHGWGGSSASWTELAQSLENAGLHARMCIPDFPGFGQSSPPLEAWNVDTYVQCISDYLYERKIEKIIIIAHSFGGRVALKFSLLHPERVERLILFAPAIIRHTTRVRIISFCARILRHIFYHGIFQRFFLLLRRMGYRFLRHTSYTEEEGVMKETHAQIVTEDLTPLLPKFHHPLLLFWGKHDTYVSVHDAKIIQSVISKTSLYIFPDGRHGIHRTHVTQTTPIIMHFLSQ